MGAAGPPSCGHRASTSGDDAVGALPPLSSEGLPPLRMGDALGPGALAAALLRPHGASLSTASNFSSPRDASNSISPRDAPPFSMMPSLSAPASGGLHVPRQCSGPLCVPVGARSTPSLTSGRTSTSTPPPFSPRTAADRNALCPSPSSMTANRGTVRFMAPELMVLPEARSGGGGAEAEYSLSADIYSTGMLLWSIATRRGPFAETAGTAELMRMVKRGRRPELSGDPACPQAWNDLIDACWAQDPESRPDIRVVHHVLHALAWTASVPPSPEIRDGTPRLGRGELPAVPC